MSKDHRWRRKCFVICLLALFIGLMAYSLADDAITIANNANSSSTNATGCTGDCDFNNLNVNALGKNDTFNPFGFDIFLSSPFINSDGTDSSTLDLGDGTYSRLITENATYAGSLTLNRDHAQISVGNAQSSDIDVYPGYINLVADTTGYSFNKTYFDMAGASLTNCANCGIGTDNTKVNKTGDTFNLTGNTRVNMSYGGKDLGSYDTWDYLGLSFTFFTSNRFQTKVSGWTNLSYPERKGATVVWQDDSYTYYTFPANSTTPVAQYAMDSTGVYISQSTGTGNTITQMTSNGRLFRNNSAGAGITLRAPNGNYFCMSVNNAGTLSTVSGSCP